MRSPYRNTLLTDARKAEVGSISIPLLIVTVILGSALFSSVGYALLWKSKVSLQLRIDTCVEKVSMELLQTQTLIDASNERMRLERLAAAAAAIPTGGGSIEAVKPVLFAERIFQESLRYRWKAKQAEWILRRGCDSRGDLFLPLPSLRWWRPPDDGIGPMPLEWEVGAPSELSIRLWNSNRFSRSVISKGGKDGSRSWQARWASFH